jgi:dephospho-CoA kinase
MSTARPAKPVIGLIGGIGSGKSQVSAALARRGGRVVAGDPLGHEALRQPEVVAEIVRRWGPGVLDAAGQVDRRTLGARVFADPAERRELEAIVHPWIARRLREQIAQAQADPAVAFVVLDAAVMLEAGWESACEVLVYVHAPRATRLRRVAGQRGWSAAEAAARERAQLPLTEKAARADVALDNSGPLEQLGPQLDALLERLGVATGPGRPPPGPPCYDDVRAEAKT